MVITRIPPSPTGHLHIGTARTGLFNYLFAKHHNGKLIFRSEDTDKSRSRVEYEAEIIEGLRWLGITWDNDVIIRQSERSHIYKEKLEHVIAAGHAYISREPSKNDPTINVEVVRLKNPNKDITFHDLVRGDITFNTTELGDIVIARSLDDALYHFTVVVDDQDAGVTHVIRGEDHISNTPRQILIQEALGYTRPAYAHIPLILAPDKSKMSKRHGTVAIDEYRNAGFLPEAIVNYLALMGWNPGTNKEIFSLNELIEIFSLDNVQKSGAIFNKQKFTWFNRQYLEKLPDNDFETYIKKVPFIANLTDEVLKKLLPALRERTNTREELQVAIESGEYDFLKEHIIYDTHKLTWKNDPHIQDVLPRLNRLSSLLTSADFTSPETIKEAIWSYVEETGKGEVLWPLRIALSGQDRSPDPFTLAYILGKSTTLSRIEFAYAKIESDATS